MKTFVLFVVTLAVAVVTTSYVNGASPPKSPQLVSAIPTSAVSPVPSLSDDTSFEASKEVYRFAVTPKNTITIFSEINESSLAIAQEITEKGKTEKDLYILINSPGGSVLDGAQIVAAIQASPAKVHTVCMGLCASMASIIHGYGHERLMVDRSILMNHQAALGLSGPIEIVRSRLHTLYRYTQKMDKYIAARAGLTLEQFNAVFTNEQWIDAEDATRQHFNDKIVSVDLSGLNDSSEKSLQSSIKETKVKLQMMGF